MTTLDCLRLHVINVGHGDAMILELPDEKGHAHFGIVDTGRSEEPYRGRLTEYLKTILEIRELAREEWSISFVCITHPHDDHCGGLSLLLKNFKSEIREFWDNGLGTGSTDYYGLLDELVGEETISLRRLSSRFKTSFGDVEISALAPTPALQKKLKGGSIYEDNGSIILKVRFHRSVAILGGDAQFESWREVIRKYGQLGDAPRGVPGPLKCQLLKVSHHGGKRGISLEYLEELTPQHFMITSASPSWYRSRPGTEADYPHPLTLITIHEACLNPRLRMSHLAGNVIYTLDGTTKISANSFTEAPGDWNFRAALRANLSVEQQTIYN